MGIIFSQRRLGKPYVVQGLVLQFDRLMMIFGRHLLIKDIFDVISSISLMINGFFDRIDKRQGTVFIF